MTYQIYIGFDEREKEPYQVAKHSILSRTSVPVEIVKLWHRPLRSCGLFKRPWTIDSSGQYIDQIDNKPFSTQFSHSRFLVPELWRNNPQANKSDFALFMDCDQLVLTDIAKLFEFVEDIKRKTNGRHPVYCVQHEYKPETQFKMDGSVQIKHNRKLWSSFMIFDMSHPDNEKLTPDMVNTADGKDLHNFCWLEDTNSIGRLDEGWNFIPDHSERNTKNMFNVHYTLGGPWFDNYRNCRYSKLWWDEYNSYVQSKVTNVQFNLLSMLSE